MSVEIKNPKARWYVDLTGKFNDIVDRTAVDEDAASEFKVLLLETARNQYLAGNRSGIRWAREQMTSASA
jgi:hypothetical protein